MPSLLSMCRNKMQTDDLLEMISSISRKQMRIRDNLRMEVLLKSTHKLLDQELKEKQQSRKRKWEELKMGLCKKQKQDNGEMDIDDESCEELLGLKDFFNSLKTVAISPKD